MKFSTLIAAITASTTLVSAFKLKLINKTSSTIYVQTGAASQLCGRAPGTLPCTSPLVTLPNGATYEAAYDLNQDSAGMAIKAAWEPFVNGNKPNYQVEVSRKTGQIWYNWSAVEGNVFANVARTLGGGACPVLHCDAGSSSCNWYACNGNGDCNVRNCAIPAELVAVLGQ